MSDIVERVAKGLFAELQRQATKDRNLYVSEDYHPRGTTIDGGVTLADLARAAIEVMREPTEAMIEAHDEFPFMPEAMGNMIDAALNEKSPAAS